MSIFQLSILVTYAIYVAFSCVNFMEQYSKAAQEQFKAERNWKIGIASAILFVMFLGGVFELS